MPTDVLWSIEVEQAAEDFQKDGDERVFRSRMAALGFEPDEIDRHLEDMQS
jgi:hypothetical protein